METWGVTPFRSSLRLRLRFRLRRPPLPPLPPLLPSPQTTACFQRWPAPRPAARPCASPRPTCSRWNSSTRTTLRTQLQTPTSPMLAAGDLDSRRCSRSRNLQSHRQPSTLSCTRMPCLISTGLANQRDALDYCATRKTANIPVLSEIMAAPDNPHDFGDDKAHVHDERAFPGQPSAR